MILWTVILWRLEAGLGKSGNGNRRGSRRGSRSRRSWVSLGWADRGSRSRSRRRGSRRLALCLSSLSVTASRRHRCGAASLPLAQSLVVSVTAWVSHFPFFFFFFLFFPLVFQFLLSPFGFGLLRLRFFPLFLFIFFFFCCGLTWVMALWALLWAGRGRMMG